MEETELFHPLSNLPLSLYILCFPLRTNCRPPQGSFLYVVLVHFRGCLRINVLEKNKWKKLLCTPTWSPNTNSLGFVVFFSQTNIKFSFYSCFCGRKDAKDMSKTGFLTNVLETEYTLIYFKSQKFFSILLHCWAISVFFISTRWSDGRVWEQQQWKEKTF